MVSTSSCFGLPRANMTIPRSSGPHIANGLSLALRSARENSTIVVFWKFFDSRTEDENQPENGEDSNGRPRCFARAYNVFNAGQIDGYQQEAKQQLPESERIDSAEAFFRALPARIEYGGDHAYYSRDGDYIQMPPFGQFKSPEGYVSTLNHELSHWSGARVNTVHLTNISAVSCF